MGSEIHFWSDVIRHKGGTWAEEFRSSLDPTRSIDPELGHIIARLGKSEVSILDVGSGPLTSLGQLWPDVRVFLTAADPLADTYSRILDDYGISPPIQTVFATAEDLSSFFEPCSFDIVHCCNALDHSFDPVRGINEMLRVAKVGGVVFLRHCRNEADQQEYWGLHQWNFDIVDGRFVIWNRSHRIDVANILPVRATISARVEDKSDVPIFVEITKEQEFDQHDNYKDLRERHADVMRSTIQWIVDEEHRKVNSLRRRARRFTQRSLRRLGLRPFLLVVRSLGASRNRNA